MKPTEVDSRVSSIDAPTSPDAAPSMVTLSVTRSGTGVGAIASTPAGINCGTTCTMSVAPGTQVTLTATPDSTSDFTGWTGGGCTGTGTCVVTVNADTSVDAAFATKQFTLTVTPAGNGTGSISSVPTGIDCGSSCSSKFDINTQVTLTATPDASSTFLGWTGGGCSGTGTCVVTVGADTAVQASFALNNSLVVTLAGNGAGTVTSNDGNINCGTACSHAYSPGAMVTLTATVGNQTVFTGWSGGGCAGTGTCTVTVNAATMVTAQFDLKNYTLTVNKNGTGTGTVTSVPSGIACGGTCSHAYPFGTTVTLTAAPTTPGHMFTGWTGGGCTGTGTCVVTVNAATAVTATFTIDTFPLGVAKNGTGTGTVTSVPAGINCGGTCSASYNYNTSVTLTATPAGGSAFAGWSGGGCTGTGTCVVSMTAATSVTATFNIQQFTLTVTKDSIGGGAGTVTSFPAGISCGGTCSAGFNGGTVVTLLAAPNSGSAFVGWSGAGCSGTGSCTVTMNAAATVNATFSSGGVLYAVDNGGTFMRIDPTTFAVTNIGSVGVTFAFGDIAWDSANNTMYMVEGRGANSLYTLDMNTGAAKLVGVHGINDMFAIGYDPATNGLYGVGSDNILRRFDLTNGTAAPIGSAMTGLTGRIEGLYFDGKRQIFVGVTSGSTNFYAIDVSKGVATALTTTAVSNNDLGATYDPIVDRAFVFDLNGQFSSHDPNNAYTRTIVATGKPAIAGLTFVSPHSMLHAIDNGGNVYSIDPVTFTTTNVGNLGVPFAFGDMAWDPDNSTMYVVDGRASNSLFTLNAVGAAKLVGAHGVTDMFAIGYHPVTKTLYGVGSDRILRKFNLANGATTTIGTAMSTTGSIEAMYWDSRRNIFVGVTAGSTNFYVIDVAAGTATLLPSTSMSTNDLGAAYDSFLDRVWVFDLNGNYYQYDPNSMFARTQVSSAKPAIAALSYSP